MSSYPCLYIDVENPLDFHKKFWDTYSYDYDISRPHLIWPLDCQTLGTLKRELADDGIEVTNAIITFDDD